VLKTQELSRSGTPDILACIDGIFVAIELKTNEGKTSPLQRYNLDKIENCGGISMVVTPDSEEKALLYLSNLLPARRAKFKSIVKGYDH
jgi:hypothetical protein